VKKDEARGKALLLQAAQAGSSQAQFRVALMLLSGEKPDVGAGYLHLLAAANGNLLIAQNELGLFYLSGQLGVADPAAAVSWLTRAAKAGSAAAQNNLAALYESGSAGLGRDLKNAGELYTLAAKQGHPQATLALARLYTGGAGVNADLPRAWALTSLVAGNGDETAATMAKQIDQKLSDEQRKEAKKLLKEFGSKPSVK